jgi:hypothetical protein
MFDDILTTVFLVVMAACIFIPMIGMAVCGN